MLLLYFLVLFVLKFLSTRPVWFGFFVLYCLFSSMNTICLSKKLLWIGVVCVKRAVDQLITCFNSRITLKNALFFLGYVGLCPGTDPRWGRGGPFPPPTPLPPKFFFKKKKKKKASIKKLRFALKYIYIYICLSSSKIFRY